MIYYGHTAVDAAGKPDPNVDRWQALATHLDAVAQTAEGFALPLAMESEAELAGLLHDVEKYAARFQARLRNPAPIHGVNHWTAGAVSAVEGKLWSVAFAVNGHHTGIPALRGAESLDQTRAKFRDESLREEFTRCRESIPELLDRLVADGLALPILAPRAVTDRFAEALRTRLLFSCLVDADFLDTEGHFTPEQMKHRKSPDLNAEPALEILQRHLARKSADGPVNALRRQLLNDCLSAAENPPGLFTLTAPTGSGKTLASLAFALRHIAHHNAALAPDDPHRFRRIIVVIPYTSIIEQTARVFRDLFEEAFGLDYVLEHHSAVAPRERPEDAGRDAEEKRLWRARLAAENWASPLVVTTSVQFFESLFARRPSDCRKLHNIGRSVGRALRRRADAAAAARALAPFRRAPSLSGALRYDGGVYDGDAAGLWRGKGRAPLRLGSCRNLIQPRRDGRDAAPHTHRVASTRRPDHLAGTGGETCRATASPVRGEHDEGRARTFPPRPAGAPLPSLGAHVPGASPGEARGNSSTPRPTRNRAVRARLHAAH